MPSLWPPGASRCLSWCAGRQLSASRWALHPTRAPRLGLAWVGSRLRPSSADSRSPCGFLFNAWVTEKHVTSSPNIWGLFWYLAVQLPCGQRTFVLGFQSSWICRERFYCPECDLSWCTCVSCGWAGLRGGGRSHCPLPAFPCGVLHTTRRAASEPPARTGGRSAPLSFPVLTQRFR